MPTKDIVFAAADKLRADGERISSRRVMDITGGSFRDVCPLLERWRVERKADDVKTAATDVEEKAAYLTPDGERAILKHMETVWQIAFAEALASFTAKEEQARKREEDLKTALDEALDRATMAEEAFEILARHVAGAAVEIDVRPFDPKDQPEIEAIWEGVRLFAERFGTENGGVFTAYQIEANMPPPLNARMRKIGRPRLSAAVISDKFRRRGWFELGEATCEFKVGVPENAPPQRKRRGTKKAA